MDKQLIERKKRVADNIRYTMEHCNIQTWFYCFGTLLFLVRDKGLNLNSDIDVGIIGPIDNLYQHIKSKNMILHYIKSDTSGKILNFAYRDDVNRVNVDIFRWVEFNGKYWHTYDWKIENPKNGIPSEYLLKSMYKNVFLAEKDEVDIIRSDMKYNCEGRPVMLECGLWQRRIEECLPDCVFANFPRNYGYFLDLAYPQWLTVNPHFGQSVCVDQIKIKTCKGKC